jgi:uncharacterized membrane protein
MRRTLAWAGLLSIPVAAAAFAAAGEAAAPPSGFLDAVGRCHPALVHFPVALLAMAAVAELLCIVRRDGYFGDAARFMVTAAAWTATPAALAGFARAGAITIPPSAHDAFAIHRIAGIVVAVLAVLAASLAAGVRRSGQIWELFLYRIVLFLAVAFALTAAYCGGEIVYGAGFFSGW